MVALDQMNESQRHAEICRLLWMDPLVRAQYANDVRRFEIEQTARLQRDDEASGLEESQRQARWKYKREWLNDSELRRRFPDFKQYEALRNAEDRGLTTLP